MVVALGAGGRDVDPERALPLIWGYGVGLDLTRRDLQAQAKAKGHPWDVAKAFDHSAPVSALRPAAMAATGGGHRVAPAASTASCASRPPWARWCMACRRSSRRCRRCSS